MNIIYCTFLWKGWNPVYTAAHVNAWARMVRANTALHRPIVCFTDTPTGITECLTSPLPTRGRKAAARKDVPQNCFMRLNLFDTDFQRQSGLFPFDWIVSMDLDCVVSGNLDTLWDVYTPAVDFIGTRGEVVPINGSMFAVRPGRCQHVSGGFSEEHTPRILEKAKLFGSDQAWLSLMLPDALTLGEERGVYHWKNLKSKKVDPIVTFYAGSVKPWDRLSKALTPKLYETYMRAYNQ